MIHFEKDFFKKFAFSQEEIQRYLAGALRDIKIAHQDPFPEVRFTYSYQALVKLGITVIAKVGQVKIKSIPGHHIKILDKLAKALKDEDVIVIGNAMRMKRNFDFYGGAESITQKEADDYFKFVDAVFKKAQINIF